MDAHQVFMNEVAKCAGTLADIATEAEGVGKSLVEKFRAGGAGMKGAVAKYPGLSTVGGIGLSGLALHQYLKRREAERKLGM